MILLNTKIAGTNRKQQFNRNCIHVSGFIIKKINGAKKERVITINFSTKENRINPLKTNLRLISCSL